MQGPILIFAPPDDIHSTTLCTILETKFNARGIICDVANIPGQGTLSYFAHRDVSEMQIDASSVRFALRDVHSVWWRRPNGFKIDQSVTDPKVRNFCFFEYESLFKGVLNSLRVPIINDPAAEARAVHKPFQLAMAREVGLDIPKTIMSNDPDAIAEFWRSLAGKCVYKAFTAPSWAFAETREFGPEDFELLDKVRHAPIIVQEKVEKGKDIRVNIFGHEVLAAEVTTHVADADLDWRVDLTAQWAPHELPDKVSEKLLTLLAALGLACGCIDLRQQPDGTYKFFEINPSGQFLFIEIDTAQPLLESMARLLISARGRRMT
jgi:glutathione synthase/RimK-type ligase-like ATP-grasp enzyme